VVIPSEIRLYEDSKAICQRHLWDGNRNECNLNNLIPQNTHPRMLIYDKHNKSGIAEIAAVQDATHRDNQRYFNSCVVSANVADHYGHAQAATIWSCFLSTKPIPESVRHRHLPLVRCLGPCFANFSRTNRPSARTSSDGKSNDCRQKKIPPLRAGNFRHVRAVIVSSSPIEVSKDKTSSGAQRK
jgi:hypothetical protein